MYMVEIGIHGWLVGSYKGVRVVFGFSTPAYLESFPLRPHISTFLLISLFQPIAKQYPYKELRTMLCSSIKSNGHILNLIVYKEIH